MTTHMERSVALADQITEKAKEALGDLQLEMTLRKWPDEFKAIMWDAVAQVAADYARQTRGTHSSLSSPQR